MKTHDSVQSKHYQKFSKIITPTNQKKQFSLSSGKSNPKNNQSFTVLSAVSLHSSKTSQPENHLNTPNFFRPPRNPAPQPNPKQYSLKQIKNILHKTFKDIRLFLDQLIRDFDKALNQTLKKLRKDFEQYLEDKSIKSGNYSLHNSE